MDSPARYVIRRPLTAELENPRSPVRHFFDERFSAGLREVQRRYRQSGTALAVPPGQANPGTVGTAADWMLRFLAHPQPDLHLAMAGAVISERVGIHVLPALTGIAESLGVPLPKSPAPPQRFTGPMPGNGADQDVLARSCWALALISEVFRGGPTVASMGPLSQFRHGAASADDLLAIAPDDALGQLAGFRHVFQTDLLPALVSRTGPWVLGPTFAGSELVKADADVFAAGLLLDLKTSVKRSLAGVDLFQVIGYTLLDFDDDYRIDSLAIFAARYGHLDTWDIHSLLRELAGGAVNLPAARAEFRQLLLGCQPDPT